MQDDSAFVITATPARAHSRPRVEMCEHKGIGHPDSICDGVAEAVSHALSLAYLKAYGHVQHYNADKALLVGGQSAPRFGGGKLVVPPRLIVCGRATPLPGGDLAELVCRAAREYLGMALRCDPAIFSIESAVRDGSASLQQVFRRGRAKALANDTSFGCGYFPYSELEQTVLRLGKVLRSSEFRSEFPAAGDDYKIMGARIDEKMRFTVALAFVDRRISSASEYFDTKAAVCGYLEKIVGAPHEIRINTLDDSAAVEESGIYLTVTGFSAEHGDDGQVGRGNRVNGLITPSRPMSLEAAAGKNPMTHVGKLYNVMAAEMAGAICAEVNGVAEASVQILSAIGKPVREPQLVGIEVLTRDGFDSRARRRLRDVAQSCLEHVDELSKRLIQGELPVF